MTITKRAKSAWLNGTRLLNKCFFCAKMPLSKVVQMFIAFTPANNLHTERGFVVIQARLNEVCTWQNPPKIWLLFIYSIFPLADLDLVNTFHSPDVFYCPFILLQHPQGNVFIINAQ